MLYSLLLNRTDFMLQVQREGTDITLVGFGKMVGYSLKAAEILERDGISCEVCRISLVIGGLSPV